MSGIKLDAGKPKLSLLNKDFLHGTAKALGYGIDKYGRNNYKLGMEWTRVIDATLRHMAAFTSGENIDEESKLSHLNHAAACLNILIYYYENDVGTDDR